MSSALRMLLIAILAVGGMRWKNKRETEKEEKDREGTRLKARSLESRERTQRHSCITAVTLWKWSRKPGHVRRR